MAFCSMCGKEMPEGSVFCSACGNRLELEGQTSTLQQQPEVQQPIPQQPPVSQKPKSGMNGLALAGFIVSCVSIVMDGYGIVFGIVGLVLSIIGKLQLKQRDERGNGFAIAGIVVGICGIVISVLLILEWLIGFGAYTITEMFEYI